MKKLAALAVSLMLVIAIDWATPSMVGLVNKDNYLLGFEKFRDSAEETLGERRIVLVGGSSLGWGVSAESLTRSLGTLTLNSGIHAGVGYRNFFRNVADVVDKNRDIIVISPEYSIVSGGGGLGRSDEFCTISIQVRDAYPIDCVGSFISNVLSFTPRAKNDEYHRDGFNVFGDYTRRVEGVSMVGKMDGSDVCSGWTTKELTDNYIPFMDNLIAEGYEIVYIPNFIPSVACPETEKVLDFHHLLFDSYGVESFKDAKLLWGEEYFYDTPYHLTSEGVALKTTIFHEQLSRYLEIS